MCIKNQSAESISNQEIEVSPFFYSLFPLFVLHLAKYIQITLRGQGVESCCGKESELFFQVV